MSSSAGGGGGSTSSAPSSRHVSSTRSRPSATSSSSETRGSRGRAASRAPSSGRALHAVRATRTAPRARSGRGPGRAPPLRQRSTVGRACAPSARRGRGSWRQRHDAAQRDEPTRRLDRRGAAERRGDAQRAGGVRAGGRGHHARGERRAGPPLDPPERSSAQGCPPGRSCRPPRTRACGGGRGGPFPRPRERPDVAVVLRDVVETRTRGGHRPAGHGVQVLQPDRHSVQRRASRSGTSAARFARQAPPLLVHAHPGVDRGGVALVAVGAVALANPSQAGPRARRMTAPRPRGDRLDHSQIGGIRPHSQPSISSTPSTTACGRCFSGTPSRSTDAAHAAAHQDRARAAEVPERDVHADVVADHGELLRRHAEPLADLAHRRLRRLAHHDRARAR